jgi:hypothetical protein
MSIEVQTLILLILLALVVVKHACVYLNPTVLRFYNAS